MSVIITIGKWLVRGFVLYVAFFVPVVLVPMLFGEMMADPPAPGAQRTDQFEALRSLPGPQIAIGYGLGLLGGVVCAVAAWKALLGVEQGAATVATATGESMSAAVEEGRDRERAAYTAVVQEMRAGAIDEALWLKAYEQAGGDERQQRALYVKFRVRELRRG